MLLLSWNCALVFQVCLLSSVQSSGLDEESSTVSRSRCQREKMTTEVRVGDFPQVQQSGAAKSWGMRRPGRVDKTLSQALCWFTPWETELSGGYCLRLRAGVGVWPCWGGLISPNDLGQVNLIALRKFVSRKFCKTDSSGVKKNWEFKKQLNECLS